jgi:biotin-dependent carboxylase-like uncharacterized protein
MGAPGTTAPADRACLEVLDPGLLATVQDAGRPGLGALGITAGGAADPHALLVANALLGNAPGDAVIELTLAGASLLALRPVTIAVAGADLGARVRETRVRVAPGGTLDLREGQTLTVTGARGGAARGCRAYLAVPGGIDVPVVLGSRATALGAGFGGFGGRALEVGDRLAAGGATLERPPAHWTGPIADPGAGPLRVLPGPAASGPGAGTPDRAAGLAGRTWTVSPASDRIGLRLDGEALPAGSAPLASHGVLAGAIQLPPDGRPIVLLADHQPTGGYPVIALVAAVDRLRLGQLAPGDAVAFEVVDEAAARRLAATWRAAVGAGVEHLREAASWDALWRSAGG